MEIHYQSEVGVFVTHITISTMYNISKYKMQTNIGFKVWLLTQS